MIGVRQPKCYKFLLKKIGYRVTRQKSVDRTEKQISCRAKREHRRKNTMRNETLTLGFEEFCDFVKDNIVRLMPEDRKWTVRIMEADKNNGIRLKGISVMEEGGNISPTIYLEQFYEDYKNGFMELEEVLVQVKETYENYKKEGFKFDYEKMLKEDKIIACLVNREMNQKLLKKVPYVPVGEDLVLIFKYYLKEVFGEENGYVTITNHLVECLKLNANKLLHKAMENMKEICPEYFASMEHYLFGYPKHLPSTMNMYVLTNQERHFGASSILYKEVRKMLYDRFECDLIALPSSIHEWILMPVTQIEDYSGLGEMVREVNATQVAEEEKLGDRAYVIRRDKLLEEDFENLIYPIKEMYLMSGAM